MNKTILMGRLTTDPEVNQYGKGKNQVTVAKYSLAVQRYGKNDEADFIPCTCFDKLADFAENYLHKGQKIAVEGRLQSDNYEDKDGNKRTSYSVIVERHEFCEKKEDTKKER